jgi:putative transposase
MQARGPQAGSVVILGAEEWKILPPLDLENVYLESQAGIRKFLSIADFIRLQRGSTQHVDDLTHISDVRFQEAAKRLSWIEPLLDSECTAERVKIRAKEVGVSMSTLYRFKKQYESTHQLSALLRKERKVQPKRLQQEVEDLVADQIRQRYLTRARIHISDLHREIAAVCTERGLKVPSTWAITDRVNAIPEGLLIRKRYGPKAASRFRAVPGKSPHGTFPLQMVAIDHTELDIIVLDDSRVHAVGRPWITLAIDIFSRMIVGYYIAFEKPGALAVGMCISRCILPKDAYLARLNLQIEWPVRGIMKAIQTDNAKEFRSKYLERALEFYGIEHDFRPPNRPHYSGHVERFMRTMLEKLHILPGTTFSSPEDRGDYNSKKHACMTLFDLEKWLAITLLQEYNNSSIHSELLTTPLARYREGVVGTRDRAGSGQAPLPQDPDRLRLDFMPAIQRTVQPTGVAFNRIRYFNDVLRPWVNAKRPGSRRAIAHTFRYDPRDISRIYFFDPTFGRAQETDGRAPESEINPYREIPFANTSRPAVNLWEVRQEYRRAKQNGRSIHSEAELFKAIAEKESILSQAQRATRQARKQNTGEVVRIEKTLEAVAPDVFSAPIARFRTED